MLFRSKNSIFGNLDIYILFSICTWVLCKRTQFFVISELIFYFGSVLLLYKKNSIFSNLDIYNLFLIHTFVLCKRTQFLVISKFYFILDPYFCFTKRTQFLVIWIFIFYSRYVLLFYAKELNFL